ncbi:MAG: RNA polymerase sigma factor [Ignavibacteriae bacterium]|nr:RNA polymerase sigma factor [Ignavibacteriota bacterium]NOG98972.1 RNA polymerase sigma factor [Ignavibacteriota bacterium]
MFLAEQTYNTTDFKSIVENLQEKVRNTCFRYVNNVEDADDIAQEVFIQVYESMSHFREESQISTWVYRIAVNKSLDFLRSKKRKKRFGQLTSLFRSTEEGEEIIEIPSYGTPEQELEDKERKEILDWAIAKLPENQKTAIILSRYEGFSNKEITEIMNMSLSAVEALMFRAKKNLQKQLKDYFEKHL